VRAEILYFLLLVYYILVGVDTLVIVRWTGGRAGDAGDGPGECGAAVDMAAEIERKMPGSTFLVSPPKSSP